MGDGGIETFFAELQAHPPRVSPRIDNTFRFDLEYRDGAATEHWFMRVRAGSVRVWRDYREADLVVRVTGETFERVIRGETSILAAAFRNDVNVAGVPWLFAVVRKLMPTPPDAHDPRQSAPAREVTDGDG
ncbi:SCP2 sterol-binding domain-containing protein [Micromonospora sp. WMMD1082]|uniref:SCP2 sterol-binding domain-containing protein n=1 Tax=Micromonospora sp. WMMD1082 TaxID=3016104 RepID=UPI00241740E7|nr:SCP2 sterol-binding domain-containing protein [Micromonospora sp. WMMD1082]MDG4795715.1 SCP2 sterol-binding domain-containing protein [Micromonospora sp. WMMD1082]